MADKRGISGRNLARLNNTLGVPTFLLNKDIAGAGTTSVVVDAPFKFKILDAWSIGTGAAGGTWRLHDGTGNINSAVTQDAVDNEVDRAADIIDAYSTISQGGDLDIISTGASLACTVLILCARV